MGTVKAFMIDEEYKSDFAYRALHGNSLEDLREELTGFVEECTRTLCDKSGRFLRVYGKLWDYSTKENMFVVGIGQLCETKSSYYMEPKETAPAPTPVEPMGYHNLTTDDL